MALAEEARMVIKLDLAGNASAGIAKFDKQLSGLHKSVQRAGKGVGQIGAGLSRAGLIVGGAAVAGLTAAAKAAIDFEDAFAGVRKTVNEADLQSAGLSFEALAKSFRTMATEIPIAATEFARIGEIAGALGIAGKDIEEFTRVTALMGVTTDLSSDEAADAFGRLGTILHLTGDDYTELADSIVALGNAGASTESEITEITKRFAATAKQAGLTKEEMVGLASATASLGFAPERGGTALARVFGNLATNISTANDKGKALSKGLGRSIKDLQGDIDKGKGLNIFLDVLEEIKDMKPTEAARFLDSIGVKNVSDRTIFLAMADQLTTVNEQLGIAKGATGALSAEATKRFDTIASKLQLFKNNITEAGIAIGEGMLPAIGRATDKLIAFLKLPSTQGDLQKLGKDIGAAIDDIDFEEVLSQGRELVGVLKGALGFAKRLFDAFNALPGPLKEATVGFLAINKLSGGLVGAGVGNVFGGLGEALAKGLAARIPIFGKAFVQPVFVTNMGAGGLGGGPGGAAGTAGKIGLATLIPVIAAAVATAAVSKDVTDKTNTGLGTKFQSPFAGGIGGNIITGLTNLGEIFKLATGQTAAEVRRLQGVALRQFEAANRTTTAVEKTRGNLVAELNSVKSTQHDTATKQSNAIEGVRGRLSDTINTISAKANEQKSATAAAAGVTGALIAIQTSSATRMASVTQGVVRSSEANSASRITSAIRANRPITNVNVHVNATTVSKSVTVVSRYGPTGGSGNQNSRYGPVPT